MFVRCVWKHYPIGMNEVFFFVFPPGQLITSEIWGRKVERWNRTWQFCEEKGRFDSMPFEWEFNRARKIDCILFRRGSWQLLGTLSPFPMAYATVFFFCWSFVSNEKCEIPRGEAFWRVNPAYSCQVGSPSAFPPHGFPLLLNCWLAGGLRWVSSDYPPTVFYFCKNSIF